MKRTLFAILSLLTIVSCVNDDTVTNFKDLNAVTISGLEDSYTFDFLKTNSIEPVISTSENDESNLEFRWYMYNNSSKYAADTLSREKNFNAVVGATPGAGYTLMFSVKDKTTGVFYKKSMAATVVSDLTAGTILLCEENGKIDLNFVRTKDDEVQVFHNVFTSANPDLDLTTMANRVFSVNPNNTKTACKQIFVCSKDADGGYMLDPNTFKKLNTFREAFYTPITDATLFAENYESPVYPKTVSYDYLFINGKLYNRYVVNSDTKWKSAFIITDTNIPSNYNLAPFVINTNLFHVNSSVVPFFYDNLYGRFLYLERTNYGYLGQFPFVDTTGFDVNDTGMKMLAVGETALSGVTAGRSYFAICESKDDSSKRYLMRFSYGIKSTGGSLTLVGQSLTLLDKAVYPGIYATDKFVYECWNTTKGVLWYTDGDKLYALNAATTAAPIENVMYDFAANGLTADLLKTFNRSASAPSLMTVAVRNNNLSSGKAGLLYLEASTIGGINVVKKDEIFGLGDKIIDFDEKVN